MQVGPVEPDPRCTQQREPRDPVAAVHERARQREQFDDFGQVREPVDFDGLVADTLLPQLRQEFGQLGAAPDQHGHAVAGIGGERVANDLAAAAGLDVPGTAEQRVHATLPETVQCFRGGRFRVRDGAAGRVVVRRHDLRKHRVEPPDEPGARAKVAPQQ